MAKRKPFVNLKKGGTENGFSIHVLHERPNFSNVPPFTAILSASLEHFQEEQSTMRHNPKDQPLNLPEAYKQPWTYRSHYYTNSMIISGLIDRFN